MDFVSLLAFAPSVVPDSLVDEIALRLMTRHRRGAVSSPPGFIGTPGASPAQDLAGRTIEILTFSMIPPAASLIILAAWESIIGLGLICGWFLRVTLLLLLMQMLGTLTPLVFFPAETFTRLPYAPTLEGQYIIKNVVMIAAGLVIGATARGGRIACGSCSDAER